MSGGGGNGCLCAKIIEGHGQATDVTDSKSLLISLQPYCFHKCE